MSADNAQRNPGGENAGCAAAGAQFSPLIGSRVAKSLQVFEASHRVETSLKPRL